MKIIIAGGRDFNDYKLLVSTMNKLQAAGTIPKDNKDITIISGMARGADALGVKLAQGNNLNLDAFPADWGKYGKSAGYIRNVQMAREGDFLLAFWDGISRGTKHMITGAKDFNIPIKIVKY